MAKPDTACSSARALLDLGDVDGAANRAYYAMFDAARAALLASGAPDIGRTHSGLIGAFGNFLVKNGPISKEVGRLLNRAHEIRLLPTTTAMPSSPPTRRRWWTKLKPSSPPCGPSSCRKPLTTTTMG